MKKPASAQKSAKHRPAESNELQGLGADAVVGEGAELHLELPGFEGPFDLLLHLIQEHELDILNIPVAFVTEKYLQYLSLMQELNIDVASDYLVMAATLAHIKSRMLLPTPPADEDADSDAELDPRGDLIRRLLEYQKYKHAAQNLGSRPIEGRNVFVRGAVLESEGEAGMAEHSVWKLLEHWAGVIAKTKPQHTHDVVIDRISITDRINQLVDLLESNQGMIHFEDLLGHGLPAAELRHRIVVSLLAVLELARLRVVRILQQESTGAFFLSRIEGAGLDDARNLTVTSAKEDSASEDPAATPPGVTESDTARIPAQEDVVSAPPPVSAGKGEDVEDVENVSHGQTKAEQKAPPTE